MLQDTPAWKQAFPNAHVGIMVVGNVNNPGYSEELDQQKRTLEIELRRRHSDRASILASPVMQAYSSYYKRFGKTYHVQQQLESVCLKEKAIPSVAGLVEAMFMAELKNGLLSAGHNYDALDLPLTLDIATEEKSYAVMNGSVKSLKSGDMMIIDRTAAISSILLGPDARTRITDSTTTALFVVYAPVGISPEAILSHFCDLYEYIRTFAPNCQVVLKKVVP